jgi:hypothetical protein
MLLVITIVPTRMVTVVGISGRASRSFLALLIYHNLAEPNAFDEVLGDVDHPFPLHGVVQEEHIHLLSLELVNFLEVAIDNILVVILHLFDVGLTMVGIGDFEALGAHSLHILLPVEDALNAVDGFNSQI